MLLLFVLFFSFFLNKIQLSQKSRQQPTDADGVRRTSALAPRRGGAAALPPRAPGAADPERVGAQNETAGAKPQVLVVSTYRSGSIWVPVFGAKVGGAGGVGAKRCGVVQPGPKALRTGAQASKPILAQKLCGEFLQGRWLNQSPF